LKKTLITAILLFSFVFFGFAQETVQDFISQGDAAYQSFDNVKAMENYLKAYKQDTTHYETLWKLSRAYIDVGETLDDEKAHEYYLASDMFAGKAIDIKENGSEGHCFRSIAVGRIALKAGAKERMRLAKQIRWSADVAVEHDPNNDLAYHVLGRWHRRLSDLSWIEKGFANIFLGGVPNDATKKNAVANFKKAIAIRPEKISHHLELGITYQKMDKDDMAIKEFKKVLELPISDSDDKNHKANAKKYLEDLE